MRDAVERLVNDEFEPGVRELTLADSAMDYSTSGDKLASATIASLDDAKQSMIDGHIGQAPAQGGAVLPPLGRDVLGQFR